MLSLPAVATMGDEKTSLFTRAHIWFTRLRVGEKKWLTERLWTKCKDSNADENLQGILRLINYGANVNAKHVVCHLFLLIIHPCDVSNDS